MREVAVIVADQLNLHSEPGGKDTEVGLVVYKGQRLEVVKTVDRTQAVWAELYDGNYIALHNKVSGKVFARLESAAVAPKPPVYETDPFDWKPYLIIGGMIAVLLLAAVSCSLNI